MGEAAFKAVSLDEGREALRFCNSYNRVGILVGLSWRMESADWLTLLGEEWESCDNIGEWADILTDETHFADVLENPALGRWMMTDEERAALGALPDNVTIWRGCYSTNKWGLSWSLGVEVAA